MHTLDKIYSIHSPLSLCFTDNMTHHAVTLFPEVLHGSELMKKVERGKRVLEQRRGEISV